MSGVLRRQRKHDSIIGFVVPKGLHELIRDLSHVKNQVKRKVRKISLLNQLLIKKIVPKIPLLLFRQIVTVV